MPRFNFDVSQRQLRLHRASHSSWRVKCCWDFLLLDGVYGTAYPPDYANRHKPVPQILNSVALLLVSCMLIVLGPCQRLG